MQLMMILKVTKKQNFTIYINIYGDFQICISVPLMNSNTIVAQQ